jgi:excisionase family DNA binding protein
MIKYENETYLTTDEAANFLGKSTSNFRQFIQRNDLPRRKLGGRLYFPTNELDGYFARRSGYPHFEKTDLTTDEVYTIDQLKDIFLTTKSHIYNFLKHHKITRYKDNFDRTLFDRAELDSVLNKKLVDTSTDDL